MYEGDPEQEDLFITGIDCTPWSTANNKKYSKDYNPVFEKGFRALILVLVVSVMFCFSPVGKSTSSIA
jgi:hypothetical protein